MLHVVVLIITLICLTSPAGLSSFTSLVLSLTRSGYLLSKMTVMSGAVTEKIAPPPPSPPSSSWIDDLGFFSQVKLWTGSHNECCPRWQLQIFPAQWMTGWEWPTTLIIHKQDNCLPVRQFLHSQTLPQADLIFGTLEQSYWYILYTIYMYTKFTLKYSCYLYSLAQWWMFHMDDICMSVPIVIQTCQHRVSLIPSNCLLTQTNISYTIVVMWFGMCNLS